MSEPKDGGPGTIRWGRGHVRHARIPDWILDADVGDRAVRAYAVLGRYADENGAAKISKTKLMKRLRCARSTLDVALAELSDIDALVVVTHSRDDDGQAANEYVLHWSPPAYSRGTPSDIPEGGGSDMPEGARARLVKGGFTFEEELRSKGAKAPEGGIENEHPPKLVKTAGRDVALDALCAVCGIDPASPRVRQAAAALNGTKGIRSLFWIECRRYVEQKSLSADETAETFDRIRGDFESLLVIRIEHKAQEIRKKEKWRTTLAPSNVRDLWLDISKTTGAAGGGLSPDEIERLGAKMMGR